MVPPSLFAGLFPEAQGKSKNLFVTSKRFKAQARTKPDVRLASAVQAASQADTAAGLPSGRSEAKKPPAPSKSPKGRRAAEAGSGKAAAKTTARAAPTQQVEAGKHGKELPHKRQAPDSKPRVESRGGSSGKAESTRNGVLPKKARRKEEVQAVITPAVQKAAADKAAAAGPGTDATAADGADAAAGPSTQPDLVEQRTDVALPRTVFVGNLPASVSRKSLKRLFSSCGAVESVRLRSLAIKQDLKMPRKAALLAGELDRERASGHAYVVFEDEASLPAALALNMTEHEGRHLRVDRAAANRSVQSVGDAPSVSQGDGVVYDPTRSVFAGNLPRSVEDEDVIRFFADGTISSELRTGIEAVRVVRDRKTTLGKGIAFVLYKTRSAARSAVLLDGRELGGRKIRVTRVKASASGAHAASWQGATAGPKRRGATAAGVAAKPVRGPAKKLKRASEGKRPAVAARKARALAKAARRA